MHRRFDPDLLTEAMIGKADASTDKRQQETDIT